VIGSFSIFLTVCALQVATKPDADVHLGSETFKVGSSRALERRIRVDNLPLLFQDPRGGSVDVFVDHQRGKPFYQGWRAIEAHAPGAPRRCQLEWTGKGYADPCTHKTYPPSGAGLRRFEAKSVNGFVDVDFRKVLSVGT
jgi:hypothetical protein